MYQKIEVQNNGILENLVIFLDFNIYFKMAKLVNLLGENNG